MFDSLYKKIVEEEDIFKASTPEEGLKRKEEYVNIMMKELIDSGKVKINYDGSYDVDGDIDLTKIDMTRLPMKFNKVNGYFYCSNNRLTTLEGSPKEVKGDFGCHFNRLTSLEGGPSVVGGSYYCHYNNLTNLEGSPNEVGKVKIGHYNKKGQFDCELNNLTSLDGCPKYVDGDFFCGFNTRKFQKEEVHSRCKVGGHVHV